MRRMPLQYIREYILIDTLVFLNGSLHVIFLPVSDNKSTGFQYFEKFHDSGWVASHTIPKDTSRALNSYRKSFSNNTVSDQGIRKLLQQIKHWKDKGIKVYGFRPPTTRSMVLLEEELSGFNEEGFVRSFEAAGGIWLSFEEEYFNTYDGSHLHFEEAKKLSGKLKGKIFGI